jgi:hypothetical protein
VVKSFLKAKDYRAIGAYAEAHQYRLGMVSGGLVDFYDTTGKAVSVLLSHIHAEAKELKSMGKRKR